MSPRATEVGRPPGERRCVDCGEALPPSPVVSCRSLACLAARPAAADADRRARRRALALEALEAAGVDPSRTAWSLLPFQGAPQVPVPPEDRDALTAHLRRIARGLEGAGEAVPEPRAESIGASGAAETVPEAVIVSDAVLAAACGQCRGWCCRKGRRHHAFLDAATLARAREGRDAEEGRASERSLDPDEVVALYAAYIGETHVAGSCVFHGPDGCRLPRTLRSGTCNDFFCPPLVALREHRDTRRPPSAERAFVAVSAEPGREPRVGSLRVVATESPAEPRSVPSRESPPEA